MSFENIDFEDTRFSRIKIYICYHGLNRNNSIIARDTLEDMAKGVYGIPIIGKYNKEKEDFESHNKYLKIDEEGNIEYEVETRPYGFIPNDAEVEWEYVADTETGEVKEYLTVTGLLWTELYPEVERVLYGKNNQSMEIRVNDYDYDVEDEALEITDADFLALCILGEDVEPCFEEAKIGYYNKAENFNDLLADMKVKYSLYKEKKEMKGDDSTMDMEKSKKSYEQDEEKDVVVEEDVSCETEPIAEESKTEEAKMQEEAQERVVDPVEPVEDEEVDSEEEHKTEEAKMQEEAEVTKFEKETEEVDISALIEKISEFEQIVKELKEENESLKEFKAQVEKAEYEKKREMLIEQYSKLLKKETIESIVEEYSNLEEAENKLALAYVDSIKKTDTKSGKSDFSYVGVENKNKKTNTRYAM